MPIRLSLGLGLIGPQLYSLRDSWNGACDDARSSVLDPYVNKTLIVHTIANDWEGLNLVDLRNPMIIVRSETIMDITWGNARRGYAGRLILGWQSLRVKDMGLRIYTCSWSDVGMFTFVSISL